MSEMKSAELANTPVQVAFAPAIPKEVEPNPVLSSSVGERNEKRGQLSESSRLFNAKQPATALTTAMAKQEKTAPVELVVAVKELIAKLLTLDISTWEKQVESRTCFISIMIYQLMTFEKMISILKSIAQGECISRADYDALYVYQTCFYANVLTNTRHPQIIPAFDITPDVQIVREKILRGERLKDEERKKIFDFNSQKIGDKKRPRSRTQKMFEKVLNQTNRKEAKMDRSTDELELKLEDEKRQKIFDDYNGEINYKEDRLCDHISRVQSAAYVYAYGRLRAPTFAPEIFDEIPTIPQPAVTQTTNSFRR